MDEYTIYDYVTAETLSVDDCIAHNGDYIELTSVNDDGDRVSVVGYSHVSGDTVDYPLDPYQEVGLWTV